MNRTTTLAIVSAPALTLAIVAVSMSPVLMTAMVLAIGIVIAWDVEGPDLSYLDRPAPVKVVIGRPIRRPLPIRFLPPVDADTTLTATTVNVRIATVEDEMTRLLACYHRAVASRHRARAATYAARIGALQSAAANAGN
jgi:hypothetical protein